MPKVFSTGNYPVEMLVPMLHFRDAGFKFDIATASGESVKLEMWAYPTNNDNVKNIHEEVKTMMENPKKLSAIKSLDNYAAIFIPGGHGCMINLPQNASLGNLLHMAHDRGLPTVTLCHGPSALLSTNRVEGKEFAYNGYSIMCFTDRTDGFTPKLGYLPGKMPWKCQEAVEKEGIKVLNKYESGAVHQDRELITGDSPNAANNLGKFAAPILAKYAVDNKLSPFAWQSDTSFNAILDIFEALNCKLLTAATNPGSQVAACSALDNISTRDNAPNNQSP